MPARCPPPKAGRPSWWWWTSATSSSCMPSSRRSGATYTPFPDPRSHRILLADLRDEAVRERLRTLWLDPLALDPARVSAKVTREMAGSWPMWRAPWKPPATRAETVAGFLTAACSACSPKTWACCRSGPSAQAPSSACCSATATTHPRLQQMLARAVGRHGPRRLLASRWRRTCCASTASCSKAGRPTLVLPLNARADRPCWSRPSSANWREVEPAIFGTLLERALDPDRAPRAGRALHAARLCRAAGAAHRDRAAARRLGQRPGRGAAAGRRGAGLGRQEARRQAGRSARRSAGASITSCARCACSIRPAAAATSLRDAGASEAAGR